MKKIVLSVYGFVKRSMNVIPVVVGLSIALIGCADASAATFYMKKGVVHEDDSSASLMKRHVWLNDTLLSTISTMPFSDLAPVYWSSAAIICSDTVTIIPERSSFSGLFDLFYSMSYMNVQYLIMNRMALHMNLK